MHKLMFMGQPDHVEHVRCRIYDGGAWGDDDPRVLFLRACASAGAVDCPAYDEWVAALQERGYLPKQPEVVPNPDGPGKIGLWKFTAAGLGFWEANKL